MRLELIRSGTHFFSAQTYNALFTLHGVIMIFLFIIPGIPASLGNFILPLQIGARDVAFPKINILSWWLYIIGGAICVTSLFTGGGPPDTGWTFYVPYSIRTGTNISLAVFGVFLIGLSSTFTGMNFLTTIHRLRAPGMTWMRLPLFTWSLYATAWVQLLATPIIAITLLLIIIERFIGVGFFDPAKGGDPILFEHMFWIYSHPAVYIMILPAMGAVSDIIPVFARQDHLRVQGDSRVEPEHRALRLPHLGPSYVYQRHERYGAHDLFAPDVPRCHPERHQGLQLDRKPLQGLVQNGRPAPVYAHVHLSFFHRRSDRSRAGGARDEPARPRNVFYRCPLPLHHLRRRRIRFLCRPSLLVPQDVRPNV